MEATYVPSIYEFMLGLGGVGIAAAIYLFAIMVLDFTPRSLDNAATAMANVPEPVTEEQLEEEKQSQEEVVDEESSVPPDQKTTEELETEEKNKSADEGKPAEE